MYALAHVVVSYFFPVLSLYGLHCCEGQGQAWGNLFGVCWLFELLQNAALGKGVQLREEWDQPCSVCSQRCRVSD